MRKNFKIITEHGFEDRKGYITNIYIFNEKIKVGIRFEDHVWLVTDIETGLLIFQGVTSYKNVKEEAKYFIERELKCLNRTFNEQRQIAINRR